MHPPMRFPPCSSRLDGLDSFLLFLADEFAGRSSGQSGTDQPAWFTSETILLAGLVVAFGRFEFLDVGG